MILLLIVAAGCSGGEASGLQVDDPWARPVPEAAPNAAFFITVINAGEIDETLVSAASDACRVIELHRSSTSDGVMSMQQVPGGVSIPASESVLLQPGGLHIMCIDKTIDFVAGDEIDLTLQFVAADGTGHDETVTAVVEDR